MTTVYDVPAKSIIDRLAQKLKENTEIQPPKWAAFVKTGVSRELSPNEKDWWFKRCASVMRRVYIDGPVGISRLRSFYGGKHRKGVKQAHFAKGSGSVVRHALHQLEKAGLVVRTQKEGRKVSPGGARLLDNVSNEVKTEIEKQVPELAKY